MFLHDELDSLCIYKINGDICKYPTAEARGLLGN